MKEFLINVLKNVDNQTLDGTLLAQRWQTLNRGFLYNTDWDFITFYTMSQLSWNWG